MLRVTSEALEAWRESHMGDFLRLIPTSFIRLGLVTRARKEMPGINCHRSGSVEASGLIFRLKKRKEHPFSDTEGGSLRLWRSDHHSKVGLGFTNVVGSPLAVSEGGESEEEEEEEEDEDEEEEEEEEEGGDTEMILIAMWVTLTMPEGFGYITDSTVTEETLRRLRDEYGIPNKKQGEVSLPEESRKILQRIKDKKYNPLGRGGDPFNQYLVHQILKISAPSHGYQASDLFQIVHSVTKLTLPHSPRLIEVKKEEGSKQWSVPVRIPKLPIPSIFSAKLSVLELETWLGHGQGKGPLKAFNIPAFKEKEPPTFSEEEPWWALVAILCNSECYGQGFKCFLTLEQLVVYFKEELHVFKRMRVDVEAHLKHTELALVHLSTEKQMVEETQAGMAEQVLRWKLDLEKEVIRSTCCAYERNELRKQLMTKEREMEAA
ncbi:hypothetical protein LWI28_018538 [Acer negundo]|uniref:Uncharacterized protein n=1 Tax=Acer negundo TaxID=4023 RepID=A0AAD5IRP3_ACENE|nr:hypothetical protein LWI28_018538 [Acer negundo]